MSESVKGIRPLLSHLVGLARRANRPRPAIAKSVDHMIDSIHTNFDVGGRPPFEPHAESTRRRTYGPSRILIKKGRLRNSFVPLIRGMWGAAVSNVIYGPRHHFGYPGGPGRGHAHTPAREFAFLQDADEVYIGDVIFMGYIVHG